MLRHLLVIIMIALMSIGFGCTTHVSDVGKPDPVVVTQKADDQSYPQMMTPEMIERQSAVEAEFNVTFLGAYTPDNGTAWIVWARDNTTGKCHATMIIRGRGQQELSCGQAYEIYRETCAKIGNCT